MVEHITKTAELSTMTTPVVTATLLIFLGSYGIIISEKIHRTIIALLGGALMILAGALFNFYNQEQAIEAIDFNTIGLLVGMMVITSIIKDTGFFQYVAIKTAKVAKGNPWKIMVMFAILTAVFSALLNNVTTVLLMAPMTLIICSNLKITPLPFLMIEIFMSNIGGTATLIGDPPNILIGSAAGLNFMEFLINLWPVVFIIFCAIIILFKILYGKQLTTSDENMKKIMNLDEKEMVTDITLLKKSLFVLGLVILWFCLHGWLHLEGATIAIFGASLLLLLDHGSLKRTLHEDSWKEVEWVTIFFFIGLFTLVWGLEHSGIISWAAEKLITFTDGNLKLTSLLILWGGAFFSAFVDNIPFVATMIPLVESMKSVFTDLDPIWWSLSLGACLGGNGSLVGASANLVVAGIADKAGYKIKFVDFMKIGFIVMIISVAIAHIYILYRFL